jgi:hypothetical protein
MATKNKAKKPARKSTTKQKAELARQTVETAEMPDEGGLEQPSSRPAAGGKRKPSARAVRQRGM